MYVGVERERKVIVVIVIASMLAILLGLAIMLITIRADRSRLQGVAGDGEMSLLEEGAAGAAPAMGADLVGSGARARGEVVAEDIKDGPVGG